jgi:type I restriction enzyme S subunit
MAELATDLQKKTGYNKTNPNDWQALKFREIASKSKAKFDPSKSSEDHLPCIELEHIESATGRLNGTTSTSSLSSVKNYFTENSVLFGKLRPYLEKFHLPAFLGACSSEIWVLSPSDRCTRNYLYLIVQSNRFLQAANVTSGTKMPRSDWAFISEVKFPLPPIPEQQKIAAILSTWDGAMDTLGQLIAKKEELKKGLMQQLLTGKKRFDGFDGEWEEVRLRDICTASTGKTKPVDTTPEPNKSNSIPVFGGNGISGYSSEFNLSGKRILIGRVGEYCGCVHLVEENYWVTDNCLYLKELIPTVSVEFLSRLLTLMDLARLRNKGGQPLISQKPIMRFLVNLPNVTEQQKIASVLAAAYREIENLQRQLEKLMEEKKGLMQKLLTGEVRVETKILEK